MEEADDLQRKNLYLLLNPDGSLIFIIISRREKIDLNQILPWSEVYWLYDQFKQTLHGWSRT